MCTNPRHVPVMLAEVVSILRPVTAGTYVDCTLGSAGHAAAILAASAPAGRLVGVDRDTEAVARAREELARFGDRAVCWQMDYRDLPARWESVCGGPVNGILVDMGVSLEQLRSAERGFSFRDAGPLDMRMDTSREVSLAELINTADLDSLAKILRDGGQARFSYRISRLILERFAAGRLATTADLAAAIEAAIPRRFRPRRIHPATVAFQALRIAVNAELDNLASFLTSAAARLGPGGRLVVIAYHSLEDRIVKGTFRNLVQTPATAAAVTYEGPRRIMRPTAAEIAENASARSAKLRWIERREEE
ncbi:MAG: 16S rRNA (cytosine(1402)-N(4))-methyltransferase RsmH [Candidatus Schekmanbacteria bacterium]|nr:16S rRNA (cytosine(1402)-N(4))-methyltransferase RsmH [Candidatus Schekmanbacteria bacterium]